MSYSLNAGGGGVYRGRLLKENTRSVDYSSYAGIHGGLSKMLHISQTWTPKISKIMAFMAVIMGLGLLFYILLGFRNLINPLHTLEILLCTRAKEPRSV